MSQRGGSGTSSSASVLRALGVSPNAADSKASSGKISKASIAMAFKIEDFTWVSLLSACIDFLSDGGCEVRGTESYELHVQVISLLLVLVGTQASSSDLVRGHELASSSSSPEAELATLSKEGSVTQDPFLRAMMLLGSTSYMLPVSASSGSDLVSPPAGFTRALGLLRALLRNVCVDGVRTMSNNNVTGPRSNAAACKASHAISEKRQKALAALAKSGVSSATNASQDTNLTLGSDSAVSPSSPSRPVAAQPSLSTLSSTSTSSSSSSSSSSALLSAVSIPASFIGSLIFEDTDEVVGKPLAERSALLVLLMAHNFRADEASLSHNPYRKALSSLVDDKNSTAMTFSPPFKATLKSTPSVGAAISPFESISFKNMFSALVILCTSPLGTALLYTLIQTCPRFMEAVDSRTDVHTLVLPLLEQLYSVHCLGPDHRYLLLVILLVFTQDAAFCESASTRITISPSLTAWYTDRRLGEISLGSLMSLCLMRSVVATSALATAGANDSFLHTNAFAALSNLAPHTEKIHPYTAQKILLTLHSLHKKHRRLAVKLEEQSQNPASIPANLTNIERISGLVEHYEHCITVGCEAILAMCAPSLLPRNIDLLYAMIHERSLLDALGTDNYVEPAVRPLLAIVSHFSNVLHEEAKVRALKHLKSGSGGAAEAAVAEAEAKSIERTSSSNALPSIVNNLGLWEAADVARCLLAASKSWKEGGEAARARDTLSQTKFIYSEDKNPELFFVPHTYNLVYHFTPDLVWVPSSLKIFVNGPSDIYLIEEKTS